MSYSPCRTLAVQSNDEIKKLAQMLAVRDTSAVSTLDVEKNVREILARVQQHSVSALIEYTQKFDCPDFRPDQLTVLPAALEQAAASIPAADTAILQQAIANVRHFHEAQKEQSWFMHGKDGTILGQTVHPVDCAGLYVPGGQGGNTPLISSLIMNAVPALIAAVPDIVVVSPPRADGTINPYILATAHLLGVQQVYAVGSAWAIAALAYGAGPIPAVDVIAGPGNIFVATAKRLLQGTVGIDMLAGPSEVLVLADKSANPAWIAADMLSQAEHDTLASAVLVTDDAELAEKVQVELQRQIIDLPRAAIAQQSLQDWGIIAVVPSIDVGIALANAIAPEHLEVLTENPWELVGQLRHAGAIFLGHYSAEALGDYMAGPNHVLPTLGTARFSSALSVQTFCKKTSIIAASPAFAKKQATAVARLSRLEGLEAHARAAEQRLAPKYL